MRRRAATTLLVLILGGCATGSAPDLERPTVTIADGFFLELWVQGEGNYAVLYRVNGARRLGYGGGLDAINRQLSWTGELTPEELDRLDELLEEHGWYEGKVESTGKPPKHVSRINLRSPRGHRRFKVKGRSSDVTPIEKLLEEASMRRLKRDLDVLPEAGEQR